MTGKKKIEKFKQGFILDADGFGSGATTASWIKIYSLFQCNSFLGFVTLFLLQSFCYSTIPEGSGNKIDIYAQGGKETVTKGQNTQQQQRQ